MSEVAVVGVGAIGGYVAAQLATAGHDVVPCARSPFDRLVVELGERRIVVERPATTDPDQAAPVDWVVVATKAHEADGCRGWLRALCGHRTRAVVVAQNGVDGALALAESAGGVPVVPAVVLVGAERLAPGHVRHHGGHELVVPAPWAEPLGALVARSDLAVRGTEDFAGEAWRKLALNAMSGPICALTGRRLDVFADEAVAEVARAVGREAVAVARAEGVALDDDVADELLALLQAQPPTMGASLLYDRLAGRPTEHDAILGPVVRGGQARGVPTPRSAMLLALLAASEPLDGPGTGG